MWNLFLLDVHFSYETKFLYAICYFCWTGGADEREGQESEADVRDIERYQSSEAVRLGGVV